MGRSGKVQGLVDQSAHPVDQHGSLAHLDAFVQRVDIVVVEHGYGNLGDDRPGVDTVVHHEQGGAGDLDAVLEGLTRRVHAGERWQQRRVGVDGAAAEEPEEGRSDESHETGQDDEVGLVRGDRLGELHVPVDPVVELGRLDDEGGDAGPLGAGQALDVVAVGADGDDLGPVVRSRRRCVDQGLQIGATTGDEDDETSRPVAVQAAGGHGRHDSARGRPPGHHPSRARAPRRAAA